MKPVLEVVSSGVMASWVFLGAGIQLATDVLGPDTAVGVGVVVNVAMLLGAAYLLFKAGGTFRDWMVTVGKAIELAGIVALVQSEQARAADHRAAMEKEMAAYKAEMEEKNAVLRGRVAANERIVAELQVRLGLRRNPGEETA